MTVEEIMKDLPLVVVLHYVLKRLFQCFFIYLVAYFAATLLGNIEFTVKGLLRQFVYPNWFVRSYVILYCFSPVLNAFIKTADYKTFNFAVIAFFGAEMFCVACRICMNELKI